MIASGCAALVAYIGPGAGLGLLGALIAVAGALFAALFFVALWPVRILLRRTRGESQRAGGPHVSDGSPTA